MDDLDLDVPQWKVTAVLVVVVVLVVVLLVVVSQGAGSPSADPPPTTPGYSTTIAPRPPGPTRPGRTPTGQPPSGQTSPSQTAPGTPPTAGTGGTPGPTPGSEPVCVTSQDKARLRVLVYNIKAGQVAGGIGPIARLIKATNADVALLQEVDQLAERTGRVDQPSVLGDQLQMAWGYGRNIGLGSGSYGTVILSRYALTGLSNTALPNQRGEEQRGLLHATIVVNNIPVSLYTTHLEAGPVSGLRQAQARQIAAVVEADDNAVIMGGDFNAGPSAPEIGQIRSALLDTWSEAGTGNGNTVPARNPVGRIDYTFHSPGTVTAVSSTVLPALLSDHRAMLSDYVVQGSATRTCVDLPLPAG